MSVRFPLGKRAATASNPGRHRGSGRAGRPVTAMHRMVAALVAVLATIAGLAYAAIPASAAPVYQITGEYGPNTPATVAKGDVVTGVWRVNVNDGANPPANNQVKNVNFSVTLQHGLFKAIPDACLTTGVTPTSSISSDGRTLVCNLGTQKEGTADVVQTPFVADGMTGDQLSATGTIAGHSAKLPPININNPFGMDMLWGTPSDNQQHGTDNNGNTTEDFDFEWTLNLNAGSDAGPNSVTYNVTLNATNNADQTPVPLSVSQDGAATGVVDGCSPFTIGNADGHPWSGGDHPANRLAPYVGSCTFTQTGANTFQLTLSGIDYSQAQAPNKDSAGNTLPTNVVPVASGSIWLHFTNAGNTTVNLQSNAPTYTSVAGATSTDDASNNTSSKVVTAPGLWVSAYARNHTNSGGTAFDNTYKVAAGTEVETYTQDNFGIQDYPGDTTLGNCAVIDTKYATFSSINDSPVPAGVTVEYYTGNAPTVDPTSAQYDPNAFSCGTGGADPGATGWTTTEPTDLTTIKAVRIQYPKSSVQGQRDRFFDFNDTINTDTPVGTDVWTWHSYRIGGAWQDVDRDTDGTSRQTNVPGGRYPYTTPARDVLHVIGATPAVTKSVDRTSIKPGVPATYTLNYTANTSGVGAPTVDGFTLTDTLPVGMTYVDGSSTPAPTITTDAQGQQVLTWTLNGVPVNQENKLTYQAVADGSVTAGQTLTNSVTASLGGQTSTPATADVVVSNNGFTTISKVADEPTIPNPDGTGNGDGSWTVTLGSTDPTTQPFTDTIDILPYKGDGRGTSFSGSYTLREVTPPAGGTVYYSTAKPSSLSDDPADASNGSAGSITGNTVGWSTTFTPNATAVRVIGGALASGATQQFQVPITTRGAQPGDKLVNRAQARAGHTVLVMRTSAAITIGNPDYVTTKAADPASGTPLHPGQVVHYTVTVKQQHSTPANAQFTDDLSDVLDDATYNKDVKASVGTVRFTGKALVWTGTLPVGAVATVTYSVTVHNVAGLKTSNTDMPNTVHSPGCRTVASCMTDHKIGDFTYSKKANPKSGSTVPIGGKVTYTVTVQQHGKAAVPGASVMDNLSKVLDDATYNGDIKASSGKVSYTRPRMMWKGDLAVGQHVKITYSVTVTGHGNKKLTNFVNSNDPRGSCDTSIGCSTSHDIVGAAANAGTAGLGSTGNDTKLQLILAALLLGAGSVFAFAGTRRRRSS